MSRSSSRRSSSRSGALALRLGGISAITGAVIGIVLVIFTVQTVGNSAIANQEGFIQRLLNEDFSEAEKTFIGELGTKAIRQQRDVVDRGRMIGLILAVVGGLASGLVGYLLGSNIASRLTDLKMGLAKMGRGAGDVRVRFSGNDEVATLGKSLQMLATDLSAMAKEAEKGGAVGANVDPLVREMRDRTLPDGLPQIEGFEADGTLIPGTRGGMDHFDCVLHEGRAVMFLVSPEGVGPVSAIAARMARDEILRALTAGATPRKALAHTNRVLHKQLPKSGCAMACVLELGADEAKLYQAGFRAPLLVCRAGQVETVNAEGLALGLDAGPVFEKGLRSTTVPVSQGTRLVMANEAALRLEDFEALVAEQAPKHTAPFMNLVMGAIEQDAGEDGLREDVVLLTAKRW